MNETMRNHTAPLRTGAALLLLALVLTFGTALAPSAHAAGKAPDPKTCRDPAKDDITQGGCMAIDVAKGNCQACHAIAGIPSGNIAAPLVGVAQRYPGMHPDEQQRLQQQMQSWAQLTPEQRKVAREQYKSLKALPPDKKEEVRQKWEEYQNLPPERKREREARPTKNGRPMAPMRAPPPPPPSPPPRSSPASDAPR